jgi:hypothetical protein
VREKVSVCVCVCARSRPAVRPAFVLLLLSRLKISFGELGFFVSSCFQAQQVLTKFSIGEATLISLHIVKKSYYIVLESRVVDADSMTLWIRIRIQNTNPDLGARKCSKNFSIL